MSHIRILSEQLANQIAAGEVVERPASVVKELVENSLDAGASRITVEVEGGGTRLIRVIDDGCGMDEDDVLLCLERHATSKLQDETALAAITTLGFRGEALPSIGSVSHMTITSRPQEQELGTRAEMRFGTLSRVHEQGCRSGTCIEVRNLFGNMPARRKFLKSRRTELFHIEEVIRNQALAHPGVMLSLRSEGRSLLEYPASGKLEERVRAVFRYTGELLCLEGDGVSSSHVDLEGFLLLPEAAASRVSRLRLQVNSRPVQDAMLRHAIREGMRNFLLKGQQPAGLLALSMHPGLVDVNVHPAKREVRFRDSGMVRQVVVRSVVRGVAGYQQRMKTAVFGSMAGERSLGDAGYSGEAHPGLAAATGTGIRCREHEKCYPDSGQHIVTRQIGEVQTDDSVVAPSPAIHPLRLIGQLFDLYLLCEREGQLVIIDQHAAHERVLYGRLITGYLKRTIPVQQLLVPVTIELLPWQHELLRAESEVIARLGFAVEHFGDTTWVISGVPALVHQLEPVSLLQETLDDLRHRSREEEGGLPPAIGAILASLACKAAVKGGMRMTVTETVALLEQMEASKVFSHCPHGRPVIRIFDRYEVDQWFRRS